MSEHNPFHAAQRLAPEPGNRDDATVEAWIRHWAARAAAANVAFRRALPSITATRDVAGQIVARPELGYLAELGTAATAVVIALNNHENYERGIATALWDLYPELGALNGEWTGYIDDVLDQHGINPADIDPDLAAEDFKSPSRATDPAGGDR